MKDYILPWIAGGVLTACSTQIYEPQDVSKYQGMTERQCLEMAIAATENLRFSENMLSGIDCVAHNTGSRSSCNSDPHEETRERLESLTDPEAVALKSKQYKQCIDAASR